MELVKRRRTLCEPEARFFMKQILEGVKFIHTHRVIHRDLKLGNLFLNSNFDVRKFSIHLRSSVEDIFVYVFLPKKGVGVGEEEEGKMSRYRLKTITILGLRYP